MAMNRREVALQIDPVLSTIIRGYSNNTFVGTTIFPIVNAPSQGKVIRFGKESFARYDTMRARGADSKEISVGYDAEPFALHLHDLDAKVPNEDQRDAQQIAQQDLAREHVTTLWDNMLLALEYEQAMLARNPSSYNANNVITLTDVFTDINIRELVEQAKAAVRARIGKQPNVCILGPGAHAALKNHPALIEAAIKAGKVTVTMEIIRDALDVPRVEVGEAIYVENIDAPNAPFVDVWGSDIVYAYVPTSLSARTPAYGYTYRQPGRPTVGQPYANEKARSMMYPVSDERHVTTTSDSAGTLITGITL
ncbi:MAG: hypothetical protein LBE32_00490 [Burkholderiales bacterium]|jgi:hypothetical protein|nr:hypothetical protein [Burkholderiales bacterium]